MVLCILISAAFYIVASFRDYVADDQEITVGALSKLQEMHLKGDISEEEFRTIQARTQQRSAAAVTNDDSSPTDQSSANNHDALELNRDHSSGNEANET